MSMCVAALFGAVATTRSRNDKPFLMIKKRFTFHRRHVRDQSLYLNHDTSSFLEQQESEEISSGTLCVCDAVARGPEIASFFSRFRFLPMRVSRDSRLS